MNPIYVLKLPEPIGELPFTELNQIGAFVDNERNFWERMYSGDLPDQLNATKNRYTQSFDRLDAAIKEAVPSLPESESARERIDREFHSHFFARKCFFSESAEGRFIDQVLKKYDQATATQVIASLSDRNFSLNGSTLATLFREGISTNTSKDVVEHMVNDWQSWFREQNRRLDEWEDRARQLKDGFSSKSQELIADTESRLTVLSNRYAAINEYDQPAAYWKNKARDHQWGELIWGLVALIVASTGGYGLVYLHAIERGEITERTTAVQAATSLFPVVIATLGLLWLIRIMVRTYLSHVHLKTDADERVILVKTYLTMLESKHPLSDNDRTLILTQLFRHSPTGINKDDYSPNVPSDVVMKLVGK